MEKEQEGINLEAVNLFGTEEQELSDTTDNTETVDEVIVDSNETAAKEEAVVDGNEKNNEDKESLKRGVNAERRARKEAERKNKELEARIAALEEAAKTRAKTTEEQLIESGIDENVAKSIANAIENRQSSSNNKFEKELSDMKFKLELSELSKEEEFNDIMDYEEDIKDLVDKGLNVEQAYYALNYKKEKNNNTKTEIERKVEAKLQNNQARKNILGNINSGAGTALNASASKPKASAAEIAAARMAGMSINDYLAAKNSDSIKQYNEYNNRKTK